MIVNTPTAQPYHQKQRAPQKPLPKEDFDFESANAKLDKDQLIKEAKKALHKKHTTNEDAATDLDSRLQGLSVKDHAAGKYHAEEDEDENEMFYDKKTSFFDNISSDIKDRLENKSE